MGAYVAGKGLCRLFCSSRPSEVGCLQADLFQLGEGPVPGSVLVYQGAEQGQRPGEEKKEGHYIRVEECSGEDIEQLYTGLIKDQEKTPHLLPRNPRAIKDKIIRYEGTISAAELPGDRKEIF